MKGRIEPLLVTEQAPTQVLVTLLNCLVLMRGTASGRATALSLACASTDTSGGIDSVKSPLPPRLQRCTQRCQRCTTGFCNDAWGHQDNLLICSSCYDLYLEAGHIRLGAKLMVTAKMQRAIAHRLLLVTVMPKDTPATSIMALLTHSFRF